MIQQTPEQNQLNSLRLKSQTDEASRLESTRIEALTQGRQEGILIGERGGELVGQIVLLQTLLAVAQSTRDELLEHELPQLTELAERLQRQLRIRRE